jgi:hypothetical protein
MAKKSLSVSRFALSIVLMLVLTSLIFAVLITTSATIDMSMPSLTGTAQMANTTFYSMTSAAYNGMSFITILPVVLVAAVVISLLAGSFMMLRSSGACE